MYIFIFIFLPNFPVSSLEFHPRRNSPIRSSTCQIQGGLQVFSSVDRGPLQSHPLKPLSHSHSIKKMSLQFHKSQMTVTTSLMINLINPVFLGRNSVRFLYLDLVFLGKIATTLTKMKLKLSLRRLQSMRLFTLSIQTNPQPIKKLNCLRSKRMIKIMV